MNSNNNKRSGSRLRARDITDADLQAVATLLGKGIGYSDKYFLQLLNRLTSHSTPAGCLKYGRVLEYDGKIVGAIILIYSTVWLNDTPSVRCHVTGWCVDAPFRYYATAFFAKELNRGGVNYLNISPQTYTVPIIEQQGFIKSSSGQFVAIPVLQFSSNNTQAKVVPADEIPNVPFERFELDLMLAHAKWGCICFWCVTTDRAYPFVFRPRLFKRIIPGVQLVYCRDIDDLVRFAGPIGRSLIRLGRFIVRVDSNGPIPGLIGKFVNGVDTRYYKGQKPRLGDLAYTHLAMCPYVPRRKRRYRPSDLT
jgi:hypothetical protein